MFRNLLFKMRLLRLKYEWRSKNKHNNTWPMSVFPIDIVTIGRHSYGPISVAYYGSQNERLIIGDFVSIASQVQFILGGGHEYGYLSTFPFRNRVLFESVPEALCKGPVVVSDDVWIGAKVTILSGVKVGRGAVVATGSVVVKDIPPYAIVGGVPAKIIRYRFERDIIDKLNTIDFSKFSDIWIRAHIDKLYQPITHELLDETIDSLNSKDM